MTRRLLMMTKLFALTGLAAMADNLLRNPDLAPAPDKPGAIADWSMDNGWVKGDIPSFQGFPGAMFCLSRKNGGEVGQENIPVEKNKWYALEAWYRASLSPASQNNLWLNVCLPTTAGEPLDYRQRFAYSEYGAVSDWVRLRFYFNSGDRERVGFLARVFGQGDTALGRFSLRPFGDEDFQGPWFQDGGFEMGVVGQAPLELPKGRVTDKEAFHGKRSAALTLPTITTRRSPFVILSPTIPATPGDKIVFSFMAKTSGPEIVASAMIARQSEKSFRAGSGSRVGKKWKAVKTEAIIPEIGDRGHLPGVQTFRCYIDFANAPEGTEVFIDDLSATLERKGDTDKQPVYGVPSNPLKNSSFDVGLDGWSLIFLQSYDNENWPLKYGGAEMDETTVAEGSRSLKIVVPKKDKGKSAAWLRSVYLPVELDKPYTVSFWAKADVAAIIDVALMDWWRDASKTVSLVPNEWRRYQVTVVPKNDNAGFNYLSLSFKTSGTYWLDAVQVESGDKMTDYVPAGDIELGVGFAKAYPWYLTGEKTELNVSYRSRFPDDRAMKLSWEVFDWRKRAIARGTKSVIIPAKRSLSETLAIPGEAYGSFHVVLTLSDPKSGAKTETETVYGILPKVRDIPPEKSSCGIHILWTYGGALPFLPGGRLDDVLALVRMLGARWERDEYGGCNWGQAWPEKDRWVWFDRYYEALKAKGLRVMPTLGRSLEAMPRSGWCLDNTPRDLGALIVPGAPALPRIDYWKTYARTLVEHYGNRVAAWEVWNETGGLAPKEYVEFVKAAHEAVSDLKDRPPLVGPAYPCQGLPYPDQDDTWIGQVFKLGFYPYVDILSAHYYPPGTMYGGGPDFEGGTDRYGDREESLLKQIDNVWKTYGKKTLWDSEYGVLGRGQVCGWEQPLNPWNVRGASPEQQAQRFVRWQIIRMAAGFERLFYHSMGLSAFPPGNYLHSLIEANGAPAPIAIAYAQLAKRLDDFKFEKRYRITPTIWTYVFTADYKTVGVYWNYAAEKDSEIRFPLTAEKILAEDIMGNAVTPKVVPGGIELPLGLNPIYLISDKLTADEMGGIFAKAAPKGVKTVALAVGMGDGPAIAVGVKNIVSWPVSGSASLKTLPDKWETAATTESFALEKNAETVETFLLKNYVFDGGETVAAAAYDGGTVETRRTLYLAEARTAKVTVDGDIAPQEYGGAPMIVMNDAAQVHLPIYRGGETLKPGYAWGGPEEGSAEIYAAWTSDTLFLGLKVKDDVVLNDAPDGKLWSQDSLEIYFDTDPTGNLFRAGAYSDCQGRLTVAPGKNDGKPRFAFEKTPGGKPRHFDIANAKFMYKKTAVGYNVEIALPVRGLTLKPGKVLGFFVNLNDIDKPGDDKVIVVWEKTRGGDGYNSDNSLWGYLSLKP